MNFLFNKSKNVPEPVAIKADDTWALYRDITELPLSRWIELNVDGNTDAIVKQGNPPSYDIAGTIILLRQQYADAVGDHEYGLYCNLLRELSSIEIRLKMIYSLIETLGNAYHPYFANELNLLVKKQFAFNVYDKVSYESDLQGALMRSKEYSILLNLKKLRFEAIQKKYLEAGVKAGREYYLNILITLEDDAKREIDPEKITVWAFCERIRRFNKKSEHLTPKVKQKANGRR
jgi:hypothetical protein